MPNIKFPVGSKVRLVKFGETPAVDQQHYISIGLEEGGVYEVYTQYRDGVYSHYSDVSNRISYGINFTNPDTGQQHSAEFPEQYLSKPWPKKQEILDDYSVD